MVIEKINRLERTSFCRRGASVLEMCLALPVLVMLSLGAVDYGNYFFLKNTFQGAAQAGVRAAIPAAATNANVTTVINNMMGAAGVPSSKYTVTFSPSNVSGQAAGTTITITITANWTAVGTNLLPGVFGGIGSSKQITCAAVMQKESS
jgi:Flp pilus assembly protein TadG